MIVFDDDSDAREEWEYERAQFERDGEEDDLPPVPEVWDGD